MPQPSVRFTLQVGAATHDVTRQVVAARILRGATLDQDHKRLVPGSRGAMTLVNTDFRWSPARSHLYSDADLVRPMPLTVTMNAGGTDVVWFRGFLHLLPGDAHLGEVSGDVRTTLTQAFDRRALQVQTVAADTVADVLPKIGAALGVPTALHVRPDEETLVVGAADVTQAGADWAIAAGEMLPALAWESPDGTLHVRTWTDVQAQAATMPFTSGDHWIDRDLNTGPDFRRVVNRYSVTDAGGTTTTIEDAPSQGTWGVQELEPRFTLWNTVPDAQHWRTGLDELAQPPTVTRFRLPLEQPSAVALAEAIQVEAGDLWRLIVLDPTDPRLIHFPGADGFFLGRIFVVGVALDYRARDLPVLRVESLSSAFEPIYIRLGVNLPGWTRADTVRLGGHAVLTARGWRGFAWVANRARVGHDPPETIATQEGVPHA